MDRRQVTIGVLVLGLVVTGVGAVFAPADGHVHEVSDVDVNWDEVTRDELREEGIGPIYENTRVVEYGNLSPDAQRLFRDAIDGPRGGRHWTPASVGAPEFDYSTRTATFQVDGQERTATLGQATLVILDERARAAMPDYYSMGSEALLETKTGKPPLLSVHYVPTFVALLLGPVLVLGAIYRLYAVPGEE